MEVVGGRLHGGCWGPCGDAWARIKIGVGEGGVAHSGAGFMEVVGGRLHGCGGRLHGGWWGPLRMHGAAHSGLNTPRRPAHSSFCMSMFSDEEECLPASCYAWKEQEEDEEEEDRKVDSELPSEDVERELQEEEEEEEEEVQEVEAEVVEVPDEDEKENLEEAETYQEEMQDEVNHPQEAGDMAEKEAKEEDDEETPSDSGGRAPPSRGEVQQPQSDGGGRAPPGRGEEQRAPPGRGEEHMSTGGEVLRLPQTRHGRRKKISPTILVMEDGENPHISDTARSGAGLQD